ncbi:hypothetical protein ACFQOZ_20110 [Comamonas endophytica]|uniref:hypothetical protein n=1 Tax=Comamonas endophytica TaxID=2949090 RepID=UPI0036140472
MPRLHPVALAHQQLLEHAAVHRLDDLHPAAGDDLAPGARDLIDAEHRGPHPKDQHRHEKQAQQPALVPPVDILEPAHMRLPARVFILRETIRPH